MFPTTNTTASKILRGLTVVLLLVACVACVAPALSGSKAPTKATPARVTENHRTPCKPLIPNVENDPAIARLAWSAGGWDGIDYSAHTWSTRIHGTWQTVGYSAKEDSPIYTRAACL